MENGLKDLMLLQIRALDAMMENLQDEEAAIIENSRVRLETVLADRAVIVESIAACQMKIGKVMGEADLEACQKGEIPELNKRIIWMTGQINRRNQRNKCLLQMRYHI